MAESSHDWGEDARIPECWERLRPNEIKKIRIRRKDMRYLMDFLASLTDPAALDMRADVPKQLPSGLPLAN